MRALRSMVALLAAVLLLCGMPLAAACAAACDAAQMHMDCPSEGRQAVVMSSMGCDHCHGKAQQDEVSVSCSAMHGRTATALHASGDEETAQAPVVLHAVVAAVVFLMPPGSLADAAPIEPPGMLSPPRVSLTPLRI